MSLPAAPSMRTQSNRLLLNEGVPWEGDPTTSANPLVPRGVLAIV